jgi:hypothetical protein
LACPVSCRDGCTPTGMAGGDDDEASAVNRPGGVKALLKQLNNKFGDSHVKLPDGTVPTPAKKPFTPKAPNRVNRDYGLAPQANLQIGPGGDDASPPKGVRAMLQKEVKSSFVKLPDGSTPKHAPPVKTEKPLPAAPERSSDDDYEPAQVPADLNLQETEYDTGTWEPDDEYERNSAAPPQLLHPAGPQQRMHPAREPEHALPQSSPAASNTWDYAHQHSPPVMSDYPAAKENQGVRSLRRASPPVLSDYAQPERREPQEQPRDYTMRKGSRPAGRGGQPTSSHGPPQGHRGPTAPPARTQDIGRPPGRNMMGHRQSPPQQRKPREQLGPEDVYNHVAYHNEPARVTRERITREESSRREARSRERDAIRERELVREREPVMKERERMREREAPGRETGSKEHTQRTTSNREGTGREPMARDPGMGRDALGPGREVQGRDAMGREVIAPPAPPALLGQKPVAQGRSGFPGAPLCRASLLHLFQAKIANDANDDPR